MTQLRKPAIRAVLDAIVARGALTYARDVVTYCRAVVKFYNAGRDEPIGDPTSGLGEVLPEPPKEEGHAALDAHEMPDFLRALARSRAGVVMRAAVRLLMLTAVRTNELLWARWPEVDFDAAVWTVPVERMKYRRCNPHPHLVPLSRQALAVLRELHAVTGERDLMLLGEQGGGKPISEARAANVIHAVGCKGRMTGHGFRAVFSSTMNERGFNPDAIERQLAHIEGNAVRGAYNRGKYWDERVRLITCYVNED